MLKAQKVRPAIFVSILLLGLFFLSTSDVYAQFSFPHHDTRRTSVDSLFAAWDRTDTPGWAVGIIRDGRILYQANYGMADVEQGIPLNSETRFHIASMSHQFTAACIALLAVRGEISLDDDIRTYVPELPDYGSTVTIRDLVYMTSGIADFKSIAVSQWAAGERFGGSFDNQDAMNIILQLDSLAFEPGEGMAFCTSNYILLAEIIKRVSGQTLREFADENIFQPLGMTHTFFKDDTIAVQNYAVDYLPTLNSGIWIYSPFTDEEFYYRYNRVDCGDTGLLTTIEDLYRWDQNFYRNRLDGGAKFTELMLSTGKLDNGVPVAFNMGWPGFEGNFHGFGLFHCVYKGFKSIGHPGGRWVGYQSVMLRFPEEKLTIILQSNYSMSTGCYNMVNAIVKVSDIYLFGEEPTGCDINQDGKLSMKDVIAFLLLARDNPSDPRLDWNNDGKYSISDVVQLLRDIWTGNCPEDAASSTLLASDSRQTQVVDKDELTGEQIAYLEKMMDKLDLNEEQQAEYRLALYGESGAARLPKAYSLEQNSPNPFNPSTTISYTVPEGSRDYVTLKVYDLRGRLVRTLVDRVAEAGSYSAFWDGSDESGRKMASGVYVYRIEAGEFVQTRKMVILK